MSPPSKATSGPAPAARLPARFAPDKVAAIIDYAEQEIRSQSLLDGNVPPFVAAARSLLALKYRELEGCSARSIVDCILQAARLQVRVDGREAFLWTQVRNTGEKNPDGSNVQERVAIFVPHWSTTARSLIKAGVADEIRVEAVYGSDEYERDFSAPSITHRRAGFDRAGGDGSTAPIGWYAVAYRHKQGKRIELAFHDMSNDDIQAVLDSQMEHRRVKKVGAAWRNFRAEMGRKTVLRRMVKLLPLPDASVALIHADDQLSDFDAEPEDRGPAAEVSTPMAPAQQLDEFAARSPYGQAGADDDQTEAAE